MIFYYLLTLLMPFYEYVHLPRIGQSFTLIKMVGVVAVMVAIVKLPPVIHNLTVFRWAETRLFFFLVFLSVFSIAFFSSPPPQPEMAAYMWGLQESVAFTILSIIGYLFATLVFVDSIQKAWRVCHVVLFSMTLASLTVFNEYIRWGSTRPGGVAGDPNYFALEALSVLPLAFTMGAATPSRLKKLAFTGAGLLILAAILLGGSRGGFLALGVSFLYFTIRTRRFAFLFFGGVAVTLLLLVLPSSPLSRIVDPGTGDEISRLARIEIFRAGLSMVQAHPFTGVGLGLYKPFSVVYNPSLGGAKIAHSTYTELAAELGIFALLAFLLTLWFTWRRARKLARAFRQKGEIHGERIAIAIEIGIVGAAVAAIFLSAEWIRHLWLVIFLGIVLQRLLYVDEQNAKLAQAIPPMEPLAVLRNSVRARLPSAVMGAQSETSIARRNRP